MSDPKLLWRVRSPAGRRSLLCPKSDTLHRQLSSSSRLGDLRSRCTMGGWCWCRYAMPAAASASMRRRACQERRTRRVCSAW